MWDVFISHASEDKPFVRSLAKALQEKGVLVWFDEFTLKVGDSLRTSIDYGLANSKYGIVVLSENFFQKQWPQRELNALIAREDEGRKIILPVWHKLTAKKVREFSPILADKLAISTDRSLEDVVNSLLQAMGIDSSMQYELKPSSSAKSTLRAVLGEPRGIEKLIFSRGSK